MHTLVRTTILAAAACATLLVPEQPEQEVPHPSTGPTVAFAPPPVTISAPPAAVGAPRRVVIPTVGVDERLHAVGLRPDGAMQTPDFGDAGWYDRGPRPGAPGPAVIVAHVHGPAGDDVFADLHRLEPGDRITVDRADGSSTFVVEAVEDVPKDGLPYDRIWTDTERPVLRLITCGGVPDPVTRTYPDNTIVFARLAT